MWKYIGTDRMGCVCVRFESIYSEVFSPPENIEKVKLTITEQNQISGFLKIKSEFIPKEVNRRILCNSISHS